MDTDANDLAAQLCTKAGMMMEDLSPRALALGGKPNKATSDAIDGFLCDVAAIGDLLRAARVLVI